MNNFGSEITMLPALVLALLANGTEMEAQQENLDQHQGYLSPSAPVATGKAPGMKVRLLAENRGVKSYAIVLAKGDEVNVGPDRFCETKQSNVGKLHRDRSIQPHDRCLVRRTAERSSSWFRLSNRWSWSR
jgi:hypothetical protein